MDANGLDFRPIDLERHAALCVRFREDSFVASFGSAERFHAGWRRGRVPHAAGGGGSERYLEWLGSRMAVLPGSCVHVWQRDRIIGQVEMGRLGGDPTLGYVNLYYLVPDCRGKGMAAVLDEYAIAFFTGLGLSGARLSVSPTNARAVRFYLRQGWRDLGPREDAPEVHLMEKRFGATSAGTSPP